MRIITFITIYFLILFAACSGTSGSSEIMFWADVKEQGNGTITLAYVPSDGFSYENEAGELTGVTIEIVRDFVAFIESEHGVELTINYEPIERFGQFYDYVKHAEGGVFGVANVTITEERRGELAFSPAYMTNIATLITHSDTEEIDSFEQTGDTFSGLDALAFEGTLHEDRLREIVEQYVPGALIHFAHSNNEIIERTSASNSYFAYVDIYNFWRASEQGLPLTRHAAGDEASEQFGIIMPLESDWHGLMEQFFEHDGGYIHSLRYRELMAEHLGSELANLLLEQMD